MGLTGHSCMQKPLQKRRIQLINYKYINIKHQEGSREKALVNITQQEQFCHPDQAGRPQVFTCPIRGKLNYLSPVCRIHLLNIFIHSLQRFSTEQLTVMGNHAYHYRAGIGVKSLTVCFHISY